jgi:hypothetical protein
MIPKPCEEHPDLIRRTGVREAEARGSQPRIQLLENTEKAS